jgi:YidC/Oxa1 family membrane protein insertase
MEFLFLTKRGGSIVGPIAGLFGYILDFLYNMLDKIGIVNIGITIILFTIIAKLLMTPLTIKQQKFTRSNQKMQPEIKAVQAKYKGKSDKENQLKYQKELNEVYAKHKTSPIGGCLPIIIQFPVLFAMYAVVGKLPAYIGDLKELYTGIVSRIITTDGYQTILEPIFSDLGKKVGEFDFTNTNKVIDVLSTFKPDHWDTLANNIPAVTDSVNKIHDMNNFLGINLTSNPGLIWPAILIPIAAIFFSWLQTKTMQSAPKVAPGEKDTAAQTAQTMTLMMPLMSGMITIFMPAGLGLYWIASSIVGTIQQVVINKILDKNEFEQSSLNVKKAIQKSNTKK